MKNCQQLSAVRKHMEKAQLNKRLNNIKTIVKQKTDLKNTGNKPIKLLQWEKDLLELLCEDENHIYCKIPGGMAIGMLDKPTTSADSISVSLMENENQKDEAEEEVSEANQLKRKIRKSAKKLYETIYTKKTYLLYNLVLLQQFEINKNKTGV